MMAWSEHDVIMLVWTNELLTQNEHDVIMLVWTNELLTQNKVGFIYKVEDESCWIFFIFLDDGRNSSWKKTLHHFFHHPTQNFIKLNLIPTKVFMQKSRFVHNQLYVPIFSIYMHELWMICGWTRCVWNDDRVSCLLVNEIEIWWLILIG